MPFIFKQNSKEKQQQHKKTAGPVFIQKEQMNAKSIQI